MSKGDLTFALASSSHAEAIGDGIRESLLPEQRGLVPSSHPQHANYIHFLIENPWLEPSRRHFVACDGDRPVAYVDLRQFGRTAFVNHVWTDKNFRGSGVGRRILKGALMQSRGADRVSLDVAVKNTGALEWYGRLGLVGTMVSTWEVRKALSAEPVDVESPHMVFASLEKFGIASVRVPSGDRIDLLGPELVRLPIGDRTLDSSEPCMADRIASSLSFLKTIAFIRTGPTLPGLIEVNSAYESIRMEGELAMAISSLDN